MPIYEVVCDDCGRRGEVLVSAHDAPLNCPHCGSDRARKLMSATSSRTGRSGQSLPGPGDTTCCGGSPGQGGCAGPGSCCGRGPA